MNHTAQRRDGTYPNSVYAAPLSVNLCPEVFTKPVCAGTEAVEVAELTVVVGGEVGVPVETVVVAVPGTHWEKNGFWTTQTLPVAQAAKNRHQQA